jgi:hypothetical protein
MAGTLIKLVQKRVFDFSNSVSATSPSLALVERIDISQFIDCMLAVRIHAATVTTGQISFDLVGDGYTEDDPSLLFRTTPLFTSTAISASGINFVTYGGTIMGHYAALVANVTKTVAGTLAVTASIDAVLRSPDDDGL